MVDLFPDTYFCHKVVADKVSGQYVLDVGGTGRLSGFVNGWVKDANLTNGIDGCNLPFASSEFECVVSVNTLEHVTGQQAFIDEAIRVAEKKVVMCFPFSGVMEEIEEHKRTMGHDHRTVGLPSIPFIRTRYPKARLTFGMPWYLHLLFIAGKGRFPYSVINENMPLDRWYPRGMKESCTVFMEIEK